MTDHDIKMIESIIKTKKAPTETKHYPYTVVETLYVNGVELDHTMSTTLFETHGQKTLDSQIVIATWETVTDNWDFNRPLHPRFEERKKGFAIYDGYYDKTLVQQWKEPTAEFKIVVEYNRKDNLTLESLMSNFPVDEAIAYIKERV